MWHFFLFHWNTNRTATSRSKPVQHSTKTAPKEPKNYWRPDEAKTKTKRDETRQGERGEARGGRGEERRGEDRTGQERGGEPLTLYNSKATSPLTKAVVVAMAGIILPAISLL